MSCVIACANKLVECFPLFARTAIFVSILQFEPFAATILGELTGLRLLKSRKTGQSFPGFSRLNIDSNRPSLIRLVPFESHSDFFQHSNGGSILEEGLPYNSGSGQLRAAPFQHSASALRRIAFAPVAFQVPIPEIVLLVRGRYRNPHNPIRVLVSRSTTAQRSIPYCA